MWVGAFVTAIGILALIASGGLHYSAHEHLPHDSATKVIVKEEKVLAIPPLAGCLTLAAGIGIMLVASRR